MVSRTSLRGLLAVLLTCVAVVGCSSGRKEIPPEETRIKNLLTLRGQYVQRNKGKVPPNVEVLKQFAKTLSAEELKARGIEGDVAETFISPRDNEPFVYRPKDGTTPNLVVFYEKTGKDGKRWVAYATQNVELIDEARFKELVPEAK
jgi:hypothetical protein